jgi:hypothetical protein
VYKFKGSAELVNMVNLTTKAVEGRRWERGTVTALGTVQDAG